MKNCPDCGREWPEHGCPAATQERLRRELWEQAALRVERDRWRAEALAARRLLTCTNLDWEDTDYAAARKANGEE